MPKSLLLIPLSFAFYFVPEVGVGAQKFAFNPIIFCLLFCTGSRGRCPKVSFSLLSEYFQIIFFTGLEQVYLQQGIRAQPVGSSDHLPAGTGYKVQFLLSLAGGAIRSASG